MTYNAVGYCTKILITSSVLIIFILLVASVFEGSGLNFYDVINNAFAAFFVILMLELPLMIIFGILIELLGFKNYTPLFFKKLITFILLCLCVLSFAFASIASDLELLLIPFIVYMITTLLGIWIYKLEPAYKDIQSKEALRMSEN